MNESLLRLVVLALGGVSCLSIGGIIVVAVSGREPPQALALIATGAVGALSGILAPTKANGNGVGNGTSVAATSVSPGLAPAAKV